MKPANPSKVIIVPQPPVKKGESVEQPVSPENNPEAVPEENGTTPEETVQEPAKPKAAR